jgi:hypothetical protein
MQPESGGQRAPLASPGEPGQAVEDSGQLAMMY